MTTVQSTSSRPRGSWTEPRGARLILAVVSRPAFKADGFSPLAGIRLGTSPFSQGYRSSRMS